MKKIIATLLLITFMISSTAFASAQLPFLDKDYTNYQEKVEYNAKLNRPINIFDEIEVPSYLSNFVNVKSIIENIFNSIMNATAKVNLSDDYKTGKIYVEGTMNVPLKINKNLNVTTDSIIGVWLDYDFSDKTNPKFKVIENNPFFDKYVTFDFYDLLGKDEYKKIFTEVMSNILSKETIKEYTDSYGLLLEKHAKINRSLNSYTITIDDAGLKSILTDGIDYIKNYLRTYVTDNEYCTKKEFDDFYDANILSIIDDVIECIKNINILDDKGIVLNIKTNDKGYITSIDTNANIKFNVFEISKYFGDNQNYKNMENGIIAFTFSGKIDVSNINSVKNIDFPKVTKDNSVNLADITGPIYNPPIDNNCNYEYHNLTFKNLPVIIDKNLYIPVKEFALELGFSDCDITYNNGRITLEKPQWVIGKFNKAYFDVNDKKVYLDGVEYKLNNAIIEFDDKICVDKEFLNTVFGANLYSNGLWFDIPNGEYQIDFDVKICSDENNKKSISDDYFVEQ